MSFIVKTRHFQENKYSKELEISDVEYTVFKVDRSVIDKICAQSVGQKITHQLMGPISEQEAQVVLSRKDDDRVREIAFKAKERLMEEASSMDVPF